MKSKFLKNSFAILSTLFFLFSCAGTTLTQSTSLAAKIEKIKIGDSKDSVIALWGDKAEESSEKYDSKIITQLNYTGADGRPEAFFSISSDSHKVVGKALWVYGDKSKSSLEDTLKGRFKSITWQAYIPCHTRSDKDKILINREESVALDIGGNGVGLISWLSPELLEHRINHIMKICPKLQGLAK